jgi:hypothetical protein
MQPLWGLLRHAALSSFPSMKVKKKGQFRMEIALVLNAWASNG